MGDAYAYLVTPKHIGRGLNGLESMLSLERVKSLGCRFRFFPLQPSRSVEQKYDSKDIPA